MYSIYIPEFILFSALYLSVWSLARPSELESDLKQWKEQIENGEADKIIAKSEEERKTVGNSTSIVAYKHC